MIKAVLLDLDGTLLNINEPDHLTDTLTLAESCFTTEYQRPGVQRDLLHAIEIMRAPRDHAVTNMQAGMAAMTGNNAVQIATLTGWFRHFYTKVYPQLKPGNAPIPGTDVIAALQARGVAIAIAADPIYPLAAVQQRLGWAGLPTEASAYAFIANAENMHFTKPNPAYFIEILARISVEPDEAVMVSNSATQDIIPAHAVGLNTFHITPTAAPPAPQASASGTLANFAQAVADDWLIGLSPQGLHPTMIEPELRGNLGALFGLLSEVKPHQWTQHPDPTEWSILQVVCHLLQREAQVQRPRLQRIATEDNPFLTPPPEPVTPNEHNCPDGMEVAHAFAAERQQTLKFLRTLPPAGWQRPARHSIFSNTTLLEMAHFTAQHDRMHITQICQTLGKCD